MPVQCLDGRRMHLVHCYRLLAAAAASATVLCIDVVAPGLQTNEVGTAEFHVVIETVTDLLKWIACIGDD